MWVVCGLAFLSCSASGPWLRLKTLPTPCCRLWCHRKHPRLPTAALAMMFRPKQNAGLPPPTSWPFAKQLHAPVLATMSALR